MSARPLSIAVVGAGKIGSTFASQLVRVGGHDVTVVARPGSNRFEQLLQDKATISVNGDRANVRVMEHLDEKIAYHLIILTLLAHQANTVLGPLQRGVRWTYWPHVQNAKAVTRLSELNSVEVRRFESSVSR